MATNKETRTIEIIVNGQKADASLKDMQASAALLSNQLKKLPVDSQAFADKSKEFQAVKSRMEGVKKEMYGTQEAMKTVNTEFLQMTPFGPMISGLQGAFQKMQAGISVVTTGFKTLRGAIISTGLGALAVALGLVINYFMSTQEGMDKVQKVLQPLTVLFQRFMGVLQGLGKALSDPKQVLEDLFEFIKSQAMNRINALIMAFDALKMALSGDFSEAAKKMGDAYMQGITGVENSVEKMKGAIKATTEFVKESVAEGLKLAELNKQIELSENDLLNTRAKLNVQYNEAKEIAQDITKSEGERMAAAKQAQAAQDELLKQEQAFLDLKIERKVLENSFNDTSRADEKELQQLIADRTQFEANAAKKRSSARSLENTINQQISAEKKQRLDEERKAEEAHQSELLKMRENFVQLSEKVETDLKNLRIEAMRDGLDKNLAKLDLAHQIELEKIAEQNALILENVAVSEQEKNDLLILLQEEKDLRDQEYAQAKEEARLAEKEAKLKQELTEIQEDEEMKKELLLLQFETTMGTEIEREQAMLDMKKAYLMERLALLEASGEGESLMAVKIKNEILKTENEKNAGIVENERKTQDMIKKLKGQAYDTAQGFLSLGIDLLSQDEESRKKNASKIKAFQRAQIIMSGITEVASIWKFAMANPGNLLTGGAAGAIIGAAQTALAIGRTGMALSKVDATQYAQGGGTVNMAYKNGSWQMPNGIKTKDIGTFAKGGHIGSPSFGVIGEAGSEWVGPNWMMKSPKYANIFGYLESERKKGGVQAFAEGGSTGAPAIPGLGTMEDTMAKQEMMMTTLEDINNNLVAYMSSIENWSTHLVVVNDPRNIESALNVINEIRNDSQITR